MSENNVIETEVVEETPNLETMDRGDTLAVFNSFAANIETLKASADSVLVADPANPTSCKLARVARLELRKVRIAIENKRKELGEVYLRKTQAINADAKKLKELIEPYEEKLLAIEEHSERVEAERLAKLRADRENEMRSLGWAGLFDLSTMSEDDYSKMVAGQKAENERILAEAKRIEDERIAKEKADAEERERMRVENERLKKEAEAARAEAQRVEAERQAAEAKAEAERQAEAKRVADEKAKADAKAKAEREAAEEAHRKEAARLQAIADKERQEREAAEAKIEEQRKAEEAKAEAERLAKAEAELAPDRAKMAAFAATVRALEVPTITSAKGREIIAAKIEELAKWVEESAAKLKARK